jgi:hypothetical protein
MAALHVGLNHIGANSLHTTSGDFEPTTVRPVSTRTTASECFALRKRYGSTRRRAIEDGMCISRYLNLYLPSVMMISNPASSR